MKLYYAKGTIAIVVAVALHEAGLDFEPIKVDFNSGEQTKPEYLKLNPKGRVPALITDKGTILTETGALLDYIAALKPEAGLLPSDAEDAAHMRSVMYYIASTAHVAHAHKMRGTRWATEQSSFDDMKAKVPQNMTDCAHFIQTDCLRGDFVLGDTFSLADPYLYRVCSWLEGDGVDISAFPPISAFLARMEARDSVKAVRAADMV